MNSCRIDALTLSGKELKDFIFGVDILDGDLDSDGDVDVNDLLALLSYFGGC